jgi:peptidoglycan/LPS O-acetylase OafA/YrhL
MTSISTRPNEGSVESLHTLTSLRFVAAMMIVVHHCQKYYAWPWMSDAPSTLVDGVPFFFVLSGFILTHVYTSKPFPGYQKFLIARFARLWPVHAFAIIALMIFGRPGSITFDGPGIFDQWVQLGFNMALVHSLFPFWSFQFSWNAVSWSISTEVFFYLAFPLLLSNLKNTWHLKLLGSVFLAYSLWSLLSALNIPLDGDLNTISIASVLYTNPLIRGIEFCLGMASWVLWDKMFRRLDLTQTIWSGIELAIISLAIAWLNVGFYKVQPYVSATPFVQFYQNASSCWIFALLIPIMASGRGVIGGLLKTKACVFLGEVSFAVYMLHQIILKFFASWLPKDSVTSMMYFSALLFVATATYLMVERPAREFIIRRMIVSKH